MFTCMSSGAYNFCLFHFCVKSRGKRNLVALSGCMRLSSRKGAHAVLSSAAWQEIRVRSGRDEPALTVKSAAVVAD